jgi:hypothetical protein
MAQPTPNPPRAKPVTPKELVKATQWRKKKSGLYPEGSSMNKGGDGRGPWQGGKISPR